MKLATDVKPITYMKNRAAELVKEVCVNHRTIAITQHGEPKMVIMNVNAYDELQDQLSMLKLLAMGQADVRAGRTVPQKEVFRRMRERLKEDGRKKRNG